MINADEFDMERAHEWAIRAAQRMGCTCPEEPIVGIDNCDTHGVHLVHYHVADCYISTMEKARRHMHMAEWN